MFPHFSNKRLLRPSQMSSFSTAVEAEQCSANGGTSLPNGGTDERRMALLAKEVKARRELLEALVKDKNDTIV